MRKFNTLERGPTGRPRMATALAAVGALVMSGGLVMLDASTATAGTSPGNDTKFFVCKYTAKPVAGEAAHHVISVDDSALELLSWFKDGQAYSYVLAADSGQTEPDVTLCPPYNPPGDETIAVPTQPGTTDPCGPSNISFSLPADTDELDWTLLGNGDVTVEPKPGYEFDQERQLVTFNLPADSGVPCTIPVPGQPSVTDPCGPNNIRFNVPADSDTLDWTLLETRDVTVAPKAPYAFEGRSQLVTFTLPADLNIPCSTVLTIDPPSAPPTIDPCGSANIRFDVPVDTGTLDYTLLPNGNVTVAPQAGYVFSGPTQLVTFPLPPDSGVPCPLGVEEVAPAVVFADPDCDNLEGAGWSGNLKAIVDYQVTGTPDLGQSVTVTATVKPALADQFAFPAGFDNTFDHTYPTPAELECVLGEETVVPSPKPEENPPVVLGTEAAVPTQVRAGMATVPDPGSSTNALLAQLMVLGGLLLLVAGVWLGLREHADGRHQA